MRFLAVSIDLKSLARRKKGKLPIRAVTENGRPTKQQWFPFICALRCGSPQIMDCNSRFYAVLNYSITAVDDPLLYGYNCLLYDTSLSFYTEFI